MERIEQRLNIIRGQIEGIIKMIERNEYCIDVVNQSRAIQKSLKSLDRLILEKHLNSCVMSIFKKQSSKERGRIIKELLDVYNLSD